MSLFASINANSIILIIGFIAAFFVQLKRGATQTSEQTADIYKKNSEAKDLEISGMKISHDKEIALMQADIRTLTAKFESISQENTTLRELVTGKQALEKIESILTPFPALLAPGGIVHTVIENQEKGLKQLSEIRTILDPKEKNPKKRVFSPRINPVVNPV